MEGQSAPSRVSSICCAIWERGKLRLRVRVRLRVGVRVRLRVGVRLRLRVGVRVGVRVGFGVGVRVRVRARVTWETGKPSASRSSQRALSASKLLLMQVVKTWLGLGLGFGFGFG